MKWVENREHFAQLRDRHDFLVLLFYGSYSAAARRALREVEEFSREHSDIPVYGVDVENVKGLHKEFSVENVPTVVALKEGKVTTPLEGVQSARFYARAFADAAPSSAGQHAEKRPRRVVVYSGPGCPACGMLKNFLRGHGVAFREVNIATDPGAAQRLARRSGRMAVPQTDIDGRLVVGFDEARLSRLLGIQSERS